MNRLFLSRLCFVAALLLPALLLGGVGCSRNSSPESARAAESHAAQQARKADRTEEEKAREELDQILPPAKSRYLGVHSREAYGNPFLEVHPETITLNIIFPDQNPNGFGTGGMLRPTAARRERIEIRLADLPEALAALPPSVWPYGRVVGVQESANPRNEHVAIRRNVEATIRVLNDLGVVVDEWNSSSLR